MVSKNLDEKHTLSEKIERVLRTTLVVLKRYEKAREFFELLKDFLGNWPF